MENLMESSTAWHSCVEEKPLVVQTKLTCLYDHILTTKSRKLDFQVLFTEVGLDGCVKVLLDVRNQLFLKDAKNRRIKIPGEVQFISGGPQRMLSIVIMLLVM